MHYLFFYCLPRAVVVARIKQDNPMKILNQGKTYFIKINQEKYDDNEFNQLIYQNITNYIPFSTQVSWFRKQNTSLNLLTIGKDSFSADPRYSVAFRKPENWRLKIRPVMAKDNGTYLCQVSTHPPIIFLQHLKVIGTYNSPNDNETRDKGLQISTIDSNVITIILYRDLVILQFHGYFWWMKIDKR